MYLIDPFSFADPRFSHEFARCGGSKLQFIILNVIKIELMLALLSRVVWWTTYTMLGEEGILNGSEM